MTVDERPNMIDSELAARYVALAEELGGPEVLARTTLRARSRQARELFAYAASDGRCSAAELISLARHPDERRGARVPLDPEWTIALARVIGMQRLDATDIHDAVLLLQELYRQHGPGAFRRANPRTIVDLLWQAGAIDLLKSWLPSLKGLKSEAHRFLQADLINPFATDRGDSATTGEVRRWLRIVSRMFTDHGIEPISVNPGAATPFDGLTCSVDDSVTDGPLITVIMSVFKPGPGLLTSVRSICNQTWRNLEILLMDDASPEEYSELLEECAASDSRIRLYRMERNGGTYLARNAALDLASGEFVTCQDADDWSHPRRLELQAKALLVDPDASASRSFCLRVQEDLHFQRPGYETRQENAVSLMFRRDQALQTIGYFDRSRKAADTEYRRRLELATGRTVTDLPAPLSMYRMGSGSLSRADFTPGWHHPARVIYRNAYDRWHKWSVRRRSRLYLERFSESRPFAIPQAFQLDQSSIAESPPHYDVVLLSDWHILGPDQRALLADIDVLTGAGYRVGIAHCESYFHMSQRRPNLRPEALDLINAGKVDYVALDQISKVSLLLVRTPEVLQFAPAAKAALDVAEIVVAAERPPHDLNGNNPLYSPGVCDSNLQSTFSVQPTWASSSPAIRALLSGDIPAERVTDRRWTFVDAPSAGPERRNSARGDRPVLGGFAGDYVASWPISADEFLAVYPGDAAIDVHLVGNDEGIAATSSSTRFPSSCVRHPPDEVGIRDFIDQIDFCVYFPDQTQVATFEPNIARAIASGRVAILPGRFEPVFGEAALYAEPEDVVGLVRELHADALPYREQSDRGVQAISQKYSRQAYLATVAEHVDRKDRRTTQESHEEPRGTVVGEPCPTTETVATADTRDEQAPELRVILTVTASSGRHLSSTLQRIWDDERLVGTPLSVCYGPDSRAYVEDAAVLHPQVDFVRGESESNGDLAATAFELLLDTKAEFVAIATLPRPGRVRSWAQALAKELKRLRAVRLDAPTPILLWTSLCSRQAVALYLAHMLAVKGDIDRTVIDYLGRLALLTASPRLEAIDPKDGSLDVFVWFAGKFAREMGQPLWSYRVGLARRGRVSTASAAVPLNQRVDPRGNVVWENLKGTVNVRDIRNGDYVWTIELDTEVEVLKTRRRLRPARGVLLDARTVNMSSGDATGHRIRYLVHTLSAGDVAYLTLQSGKGALAKVRWAARMIRKDLAYAVRRRGSRRLIALRLVRLATRPFFSGRPVWLVGERTDTAQDNGLHLFRHLRLTQPERRVYYVIDRESPQRDRVAGLGNVIDHSSLRHQLLMLHAEVLANAYSIRYLTPLSWGHANYVRQVAWRVGALRIYLKHGVHLNPSPFKRGLSGYDMVLTVMARESEALRAVSGYDEQIREIGMPRYDGLTPTAPSRTVLFMPTWRQYLVPRLNGKPNPGQISFEGSAYQQFISRLLQSPRLRRLLETYDYRLIFLPHYNVASYFRESAIATDRISIADTDATSFQDLLRTCDAFITDYSSVHFDVAYLGTPVIYARFDEADYEAGHASRSWFDYERDGYGPVVRTVEGTIDALERTLERGCAVEEVYAKRVAESFTYRDRNNSARVVAAIDDLARSRRRSIEQG